MRKLQSHEYSSQVVSPASKPRAGRIHLLWVAFVCCWLTSRLTVGAIDFSTSLFVDRLSLLTSGRLLEALFWDVRLRSHNSVDTESQIRGATWCLTSGAFALSGYYAGRQFSRLYEIKNQWVMPALLLLGILSLRSIFYNPPRTVTTLIFSLIPLLLASGVYGCFTKSGANNLFKGSERQPDQPTASLAEDDDDLRSGE